MRKFTYLIFSILLITLTGCREEDFDSGEIAMGPNGEVVFRIDIYDEGMTRSAVDDSKRIFDIGELIHVRAEYKCELNGEASTKLQYGVLKYSGSGLWTSYGDGYGLHWPDDAVTATFTAYYINGSNGALSGNTPDPKLLGDYNFDEIPLHAEAKDVVYGHAVKLPMKRLFALLTLTEIKEGAADELWFSIPLTSNVSGESLNNAFEFEFDPETYVMTPRFCRIESSDYLDDNGQPLVYIKGRRSQPREDEIIAEGMAPNVNFLLQPGVYHQFNLLYPRSRNIYATYLTYGNGRDLEHITGSEGLVANGRYTFSVLKSLGIIVEETPEDGWDKEPPRVIVDVEAFLRAANSGSDYFEKDPDTGEDVQILESTVEGTRLLHNVDFQYFYYDIFQKDYFKPILNNTFDGGYHYIYNMGCPLFYENDGIIINLGIRNAKTGTIISCENLEHFGTTVDTSYNGLITSRNKGTISNMRVVNAEMSVVIETSDKDHPEGEAHNVALLFGVNSGNVYDIGIAGTLTLRVESDDANVLTPSISIGGVAGQNLGLIQGVTYVEDEDFSSPEIKVFNECRGENGVYRMGGIVGNNTGTLSDIFLPSVTVDASGSDALESYLGGMIGENPSSDTAPRISGCIVRGEVIAGNITPLLNLFACSYAGGVAGSFNIQTYLLDSSVSVGVTGIESPAPEVECAEGGAFGLLKTGVGYAPGKIQTLACFGSVLSGAGYKGNFAGIAPAGYGWDYFEGNDIHVKKHVNDNMGFVGTPQNMRRKRR